MTHTCSDCGTPIEHDNENWWCTGCGRPLCQPCANRDGAADKCISCKPASVAMEESHVA